MVEAIKTCMGKRGWVGISHHRFIHIQGNLEHVPEEEFHFIINTQQPRAVLEGDELKIAGGAAMLCSYINTKLWQKPTGGLFFG